MPLRIPRSRSRLELLNTSSDMIVVSSRPQGRSPICRAPLSSKGVLRATMSGIAAGHPIANVLDRCIAAEAAANWLSEWFAQEATRLAAFYRQLGIAGFADGPR
jgi:hypothetical protein